MLTTGSQLQSGRPAASAARVTSSTLPSVVMGLMAGAVYEFGGLLAFALAELFFISNKNYTQRALIQKENAEQINCALAGSTVTLGASDRSSSTSTSFDVASHSPAATST